MNKFWVILKESYRKNVQSIGFVVMIIAPLIILGIGLGIGYFVSNSEDESLPIAVITENDQVMALLSSKKEGLTIDEDIQSIADAKKALGNEEIEGYATIQVNDNFVEGEYVSTDMQGTPNAEILRSLLTSYQTQLKGRELALSEQEIGAITSPIQFSESIVSIEKGVIETEDDSDLTGSLVRNGAAYLISIAIFIFITTYSSIIAQEIASEKGTRIMEVILSSVSSTTHFFGKLVGILLVCLTQIMAYAVIAIIAFTQLKKIDFIKDVLSFVDLSELTASFIGISIVLFLLGIFLYVVLAAFFGSLVTKIEDVNKAVSPVAFIAVAGFYGGMFAFVNPDHLIVEILSFVPLFTPFIMPFRIAAENISSTGIGISLVATLSFTVLTTWISLILYRSNVLVYSDTNLLKTFKRSWSIFKSERKSISKE
ncbi:ABC transporter permease [Carnobacterium funditum]|uniref:ABC transporter permease n=1 Tax=Carnobacterium funditum TaxID=2752 RepID=UPI00054F9183|nr:ABC transporter permease [Carnobacterium funditum]